MAEPIQHPLIRFLKMFALGRKSCSTPCVPVTWSVSFKKESTRVITFLCVVLLAGCAPIQTYEQLNQQTGINLSTYVGGQLLKIQRSSDLPNAFGNADVFGGKVDRGYTEVRYQGIAPDGRLIFRVTEIETKSNETTMSRYGGSTSTINAHSYGNSLYGNVTTYNAPRGSTEILPPNTTEFAIDPSKLQEFTISGVTIKIISAEETSLIYQLKK